MILPFRLPGVLWSGEGALERLGTEAQSLKARKALIITDQGLVKAGVHAGVKSRLESAGLGVEIFDAVEAEPSVENLEKAACLVKEGGYDLLVGLGGGSSIDVAKGCSVLATNPGGIEEYFGVEKVVKPGLPMIAIPTTAGTGAEVTMNAIFADHKKKLKLGVVSPFLIPVAALVDPVLTLTVPPSISAATGMDAITHAIESFTALKATPQTDLYALKGIQLIGRSLRAAVFNGKDLKARSEMSAGSLFAGISLANAGVGAVHALAYPLGGRFGVSHGVSNALLLPYVMEFNVPGNIEKFSIVAEAMGQPVDGLSTRDAAMAGVRAVRELSADIGIPQTLREVGIPESAIDDLAAGAMQATRLLDNNPRRVRPEDAKAIFTKAL